MAVHKKTGGILKNPLLLVVFVIGLTSCTSTVTPTISSGFTPSPTETSVPTAFFTPIPTDTPTPTKIPTTPTATTEPVPFTSIGKVFVMGISKTGENMYGGPYYLFHTFTVNPSEFAAFRFIMNITEFHFIKNELTPSPTAIPTEKWKILIYRYETNGKYTNQPAIETNFKTDVIPSIDRLQMYMTADVSMDEMQTKLGDTSAFTYQVVNGQGKVQQQGYFAINPNLLFHEGGGLIGSWKDGVTLGFPYSLNEKETEFFHQGKFITVSEPISGFYLLIYIFDFSSATGIYSVYEMEAIIDSFTVELFPYREDGNYSNSVSRLLGSRLLATGGLLIVELPIEYLKANNNKDSKYYLQITDSKEVVVKDEWFIFVPYNP